MGVATSPTGHVASASGAVTENEASVSSSDSESEVETAPTGSDLPTGTGSDLIFNKSSVTVGIPASNHYRTTGIYKQPCFNTANAK